MLHPKKFVINLGSFLKIRIIGIKIIRSTKRNNQQMDVRKSNKIEDDVRNQKGRI